MGIHISATRNQTGISWEDMIEEPGVYRPVEETNIYLVVLEDKNVLFIDSQEGKTEVAKGWEYELFDKYDGHLTVTFN